METLAKKDAALINDLIAINKDRIAGYNKAIALLDTTQDSDIIALFEKIAQQSQQFKTQLSTFADPRNDSATDEKSAMGNLYRMWMEIKINITGNDRETVLASCEKGENVFTKLYADVLHEAANLDESIQAIIKSQAESQAHVHASIKELRDES
ncbi:PA2169 family four-helix-bundle protein [Sphingobacterium oryzagri]|uniref:PA2169 family four-helix-bundle protein n=1 Tax=Sphingobacterium oryzagri TaxID=3025669 RepID=A0ABY7WGG6_9SPHI|nr:PA2169 family four-helix-bundle protein [Sphingobacterium sp. KACC 22765]WDF67704.1 PA2169 family four-helix-bundle protein [Sphingobacterium sp. KACC 22765]